MIFLSRASLVAALVPVGVIAGSLPARADPDTTPPTVTIHVSTALTGGGASVVFDEPVQGISADSTVGNVVLRVTGTTANVASSIACTDAAGAATSCATGNVRKARLTPAAPLVSGRSYDTVVNPSGVPPVTDKSGNAAPTTTKTLIASPVEEEASAGAAYAWQRVSASAAYGGSYVREGLARAVARFRFTGTSVTWFTVTGPEMGLATILIDGEYAGGVNNWAAARAYKVKRTFGSLADRAHLLSIVVRGLPGHRGGGTRIAIDGFGVDGRAVGADGDAVYSWQVKSNDLATGDRYVRSDARFARASFRFRARAIDWITVVGPNQGMAEVAIDGTTVKTFDNYDPSVRFAVRRRITGLSDAVHRITITVLGKRNPKATAAFVSIDRWSLKASTAVFRDLGAWVDLFDYGPSGPLDPNVAIPQMRSRGVRTIYLETARYNSKTAFGNSTTDFTSVVSEWVDAARASGVKIVGWYFPAVCKQTRDASAADYNVDYLPIDVSRTAAIATFRSPNGNAFEALAEDIEYRGKCSSLSAFNAGISAYVAKVRQKVSTVYPVGAITQPPLLMATAPAHWNGFPWAAIGRNADVIMPMDYWSATYDECADDPSDYCAYGYTKGNTLQSRALTGLPVHVIGGVGNAIRSTAEVTDFARASRDARAIGCSLYDYRTTSSAWWSSLDGCNSL